MKKIFTLLFGIVFSVTVLSAQSPPQAFSYKALIKDKYGLPVCLKPISLRISILEGSSEGFAVYAETFKPTTSLLGQVDIEIGRGTSVLGDFASIPWGTNDFFLKTEADPKGGSNYLLLSKTQLLSVPYALYAGNSGNAFSGNYNDLYNKPTNLSQFNNNAGFITNETDPVFNTSPAFGITSGNISSWNTAFSWGTHVGLYKPISYVPAWAEVIGNPFSIISPAADQLLKFNGSSNQWENWTPGYLTSEVDGSVTNEIQDLILTADIIKITNNPTATEIDLAPYKADGSETKLISGTNVTVTGEGTTTNPYSINSAGGGTAIPGNNPGDMQYWNGTGWVVLPVGQPGQFLQLSSSGIPSWSGTAFPVLSTATVTSITGCMATSGGNVASDGGDAVITRGVCWSTSSNPTISNSITTDGSGTGTYTSTITGLMANATYYVRAYATNRKGTGYGNEISFETAAPTVPILTTKEPSSITSNTAISGGNITSDCGDAIIMRGVCWSPLPNPTIDLSTKTTDGTGSGNFTSNITGLELGTTYYLRAYAANSKGTAYGNETRFMALAIGDNYQGGIVAYILQIGDLGYIKGETHGLIAAPSDQTPSLPTNWFTFYHITNATGTEIGTGSSNTNNIVSREGAGFYAARLCYDLILDGYSDWFLPSKDELNKLSLNQSVIGGFKDSNYWSSTEYNENSAWMQHIRRGAQMIQVKSGMADVRAIRSF